MADNRFSPWKDDNPLKDALTTYVKQGLQRKEAIYFLRKKIRQKNDLVVTRDQVYNVMSDLDSEGLAALGRVGDKKARREKVNFSSKGPNWSTLWMDMISQWAFKIPHFLLAIYGCLVI